MKNTDFRDYYGKDVLPNDIEKHRVTNTFSQMAEACSELSRSNNELPRYRIIREGATNLFITLNGMLQSDMEKNNQHAKQAYEGLKKLKEKPEEEPIEELTKISRYIYEKGFTAWDARAEREDWLEDQLDD